MVPDNEMSVIARYKQGRPVDVRGLINALGITYVERSLLNGQSGYFRNQNGRYEIGVNATESNQRKRFTAAHELGHFVLHRDLLGSGEHFDRLFGADASRNIADPFTAMHEAQASRFAAELLMPASSTRNVFSQNPSVDHIANIFHVSQAAANIRLRNLGLIR